VYVTFHPEIEGYMECYTEKKQYLHCHCLDWSVSGVSVSQQVAHKVLAEDTRYGGNPRTCDSCSAIDS
jgi:hypothetical protein